MIEFLIGEISSLSCPQLGHENPCGQVHVARTVEWVERCKDMHFKLEK